VKKPGDPGDTDPNSGIEVHVPWRLIAEECERVEDVMVGGWNECTMIQLIEFCAKPPFWRPRSKKPANDNGRTS